MDCFPIKINIIRNSKCLKITFKICCCYFSLNCNWIKKLKEWNTKLLLKRKNLDLYNIQYKSQQFERDSPHNNDFVEFPSNDIQNKLNLILRRPSIFVLVESEKVLIWKFRNYLKYKKNSITKLLKSVDWENKSDSIEALRILYHWKSLNLDECVELLNHNFKSSEIKLYLLKKLKKFTDKQLLLYLPQLIQSIKYDIYEKRVYLGLINFLIQRACGNYILANYFYWHLIVETGNVHNKHNRIYKFVLENFLMHLESDKLHQNLIFKNIIMQQKLITNLQIICKTLIRENGSRNKKIEIFRYLLNYYDLKIFPETPHPLNPEILIHGIDENIEIYKSVSMPIKLIFNTKSVQSGKYMTIFKKAEDLRQNQLISHLIKFINFILLNNNIDLKLTPYEILVTGTNFGFLEFIDASTIAEVLAYNNTIRTYLRYYNPSKSGPFGIQANVIKNFVKSCAGYCVITYLLGLGDRHFDNLLLTKDGKLFHIDFSYILGKDPKPMAPPIKFTKEMIEAMGGIESKYYMKFRNYCFICLLCLRRHANNILNTFDQLSESFLSNFPLRERKKSVLILAENFKLYLTDEQVIEEFDKLLNISVSAVFPALMESVHKLAQYLRR
ncbi:phosphatidylinositol 3-kinase catalytic subunit type 3-like [Condylostylus longicornis]|uniref:phosphatidylinositol 3-kinase catalytic subunit type 3-like n=1 Tax=Condylostylus longicornis TaxID=2530218 RepID=UPI00244E0048|nr:phosphatidylinositol 3-kinase catalytic subunit type 3-like [Condylostylus longicornis]